MLKDVLIQFSLVTISLYLYEYCFVKLKPKHPHLNHVLLGIACGISASLCMLFPLYTVGGIILDLRFIPIIICMLYGGLRACVIGCVLMIFTRILVGGDALLLAFTCMIILVPLVFIYKAHYQRALPYRRKWIIHLVSNTVMFLIIISSLFYLDLLNTYYDKLDFLRHFIIFFVATNITVHICIIFMENIYERMYLRISIEHSDKMHTISEIAASVAHEVRNPLTVMKGFLQLMKRDAQAQHLQYMNLVLSELDRAEFIITDYLNFAKLSGDDKIEPLHLNTHLMETVQVMTAYGLLQRVEIQVLSEPDLFLLGDRAKLKQILMNILKNAIEASHYGDMIMVSASIDNERIVIKVTDTGEGMSKEQLLSIGKAFYSTKTTGTGLGVMVTFRLVTEMEGTIHFDSQIGKGTIVTLSFPAIK
ncbi:ATP-binding protein [Paenibacillus sp. KN14-4R]|uniref:ATP-binding protein n=1 Tax=Paenibacillus sp. KN14-4R TaxID=3445773 RepID=UPI003F9FE1E1